MTDITSSNFEQNIGSEKPVLVDFWAEWCGPCKMVSHMLNDLDTEINPMVDIAKLNVDSSPDLAEKFSVQSIPTLILFKNGKEVGRTVGASSKQGLKDFIENTLAPKAA